MATTTPQLPTTDDDDLPDLEEREAGFYDGDSAIGTDIGSDTQTINSFITDYTWSNGRRYHAEHVTTGHYWGPNDEHATEQQHLTHHLWKLTLRSKLTLAPLENPQNILDLGTGAGSWAIEIAEEFVTQIFFDSLTKSAVRYPGAHVIGTDISPIQPTFVPSNCHFEVQDITKPWTWPAQQFDYIHIRELFGSIEDWDGLFRQMYSAIKPGGYVEIQEHSVVPVSDYGTCGPDAFFTRWGQVAVEMGEKARRSFSVWHRSKELVERAGFVDVVEHRYKWPMNGWSKNSRLKELGMWNQLRLFNGLEDFLLRLLTQTGEWPLEEAHSFMEQMRTAIMDLSTCAYLDVSVVVGRKPTL